ncbi:hypothetical protein CVV72_41060 (plasmid) [Amycolatopsis sp. TNS106]|nr:hypothetical protein CVV72_41060 [Amycolatopsis sp. TNS106]
MRRPARRHIEVLDDIPRQALAAPVAVVRKGLEEMSEVTTAAIVVVTTSGCGLLSLLATLVFLWKVYKRGGRQDLTAAASALRRARPRRVSMPANGPSSLVAGSSRRRRNAGASRRPARTN